MKFPGTDWWDRLTWDDIVDEVTDLWTARDTMGAAIQAELQLHEEELRRLRAENEKLRERVSQLETQDEWSRIDVLVKHYRTMDAELPIDVKNRLPGFKAPMSLISTATGSPVKPIPIHESLAV